MPATKSSVGVKDDREAEEVAVREAHLHHDVLVDILGHEPSERREATVHDELNVAQLAVRELVNEVARVRKLLLLGVVLDHLVNEGAAVRSLLGRHHRAEAGRTGHARRHGRRLGRGRTAAMEKRRSGRRERGGRGHQRRHEENRAHHRLLVCTEAAPTVYTETPLDNLFLP